MSELYVGIGYWCDHWTVDRVYIATTPNQAIKIPRLIQHRRMRDTINLKHIAIILLVYYRLCIQPIHPIITYHYYSTNASSIMCQSTIIKS